MLSEAASWRHPFESKHLGGDGPGGVACMSSFLHPLVAAGYPEGVCWSGRQVGGVGSPRAERTGQWRWDR